MLIGSIVKIIHDNGPINVFARSLDAQAQDRMAFILPNGGRNDGEYDMRMEGEGEEYAYELPCGNSRYIGSRYKQIISNCWVYKCKAPENMTDIVDLAYHQMVVSDESD